MTTPQTVKVMLAAVALLCATSAGALADPMVSKPDRVAVDAESLKKFLEDQPKTALLEWPDTGSAKSAT